MHGQVANDGQALQPTAGFLKRRERRGRREKLFAVQSPLCVLCALCVSFSFFSFLRKIFVAREDLER